MQYEKQDDFFVQSKSRSPIPALRTKSETADTRTSWINDRESSSFQKLHINSIRVSLSFLVTPCLELGSHTICRMTWKYTTTTSICYGSDILHCLTSFHAWHQRWKITWQDLFLGCLWSIFNVKECVTENGKDTYLMSHWICHFCCLHYLFLKQSPLVLCCRTRTKEVEMNVAKLERTLLRMSILFQLSFSRVDFDGNGDLAVKGRCKRFEGSTCM